VREDGRLGPVEWAIAARALPGEEECGDHAVALDSGEAALFGVVDGLGHGSAAAVAARLATAVLSENPAEPLDVLLLLCHRAIGETRGATMTLASIAWGRGARLSWLGVGNVSASVIEAAPGGPAVRTAVVQSAGIVGYQLPAAQSLTLALRPGDLLVMHTDGIRADYLGAVDLARTARQTADAILDGCARDSDDALVLTARYRGTT
jgi:serine/threonine protein phosphatase PrpC